MSENNEKIEEAKRRASQVKNKAKQTVGNAKQKFEDAGGVENIKQQGAAFVDNVRNGFKPSAGESGFKAVLSRFKNLWFSGMSGKVVEITAAILIIAPMGSMLGNSVDEKGSSSAIVESVPSGGSVVVNKQGSKKSTLSTHKSLQDEHLQLISVLKRSCDELEKLLKTNLETSQKVADARKSIEINKTAVEASSKKLAKKMPLYINFAHVGKNWSQHG